MTPRHNFSESTKRAALERAAEVPGNPRCQDPQCGVSPEWVRLGAELIAGAPGAAWPLFEHGHTQAQLVRLRDAILAERFRYPRALKPVIRRFRLDGGALLEVDHERECADGGEPTLDNALVRCVFCHAFKTQDRARARRAAPKKAVSGGDARPTKGPEQLNVITHATLADLRGAINSKMQSGALSGRGQGERLETGRRETSALRHPPSAPAEPRRHYSDAQMEAAARRREQAIEDNVWGV